MVQRSNQLPLTEEVAVNGRKCLKKGSNFTRYQTIYLPNIRYARANNQDRGARKDDNSNSIRSSYDETIHNNLHYLSIQNSLLNALKLW